MFTVNIFEITLPIIVRDYRDITATTAGSDQTTIVFTNPITNLSWVGMWIVFTSGNLPGYMAQIADYTADTVTYGFQLAHELPAAPDNGSTFKVVSFHETNTSISFTGEIFDLSKYVDGLNFSTDIKFGYGRATVQLKRFASELSNIVTSFLGRYVIISDNYGHDVYHGIIAGVDIGGNGGTIECVGIGQTNSWYNFFGVYDTSSTNTAPVIIRDALSMNPFIDQTYQFIDNTGDFDTDQQAVGGIGPFDFTQANTTIRTVLDKVLGMGNYGEVDNPTKEAHLQVWDYGVPYLVFANPDPEISDVDWIIGNNNLGEQKDNISISGDIADSYSFSNATYNSDEGVTIETSGYTNLDLLAKYGIKKREVSSGLGRTLSFAVMRVAAEDKTRVGGPGNITVDGKVRGLGVSNYNHEPYMIRAGDIILIEDMITGSSVFQNSIFSPSIAQVGTTSYNNGKVTLGLTKYADVSEIFKKQIDVESL